MVLTGWLVPYLEDALFGLAFLLLACFTLFRTLTFIHLRGKGNYVIKAFHALICITGLLRCAWFWRSPNTFIFLRNSESAETPGEFMSQTLNTLGTISLYCSFLILCCYWSYMLEHVTIKSNVEPHCFVPTHLLPGGGGGSGGGVLAASDGIDTAGPLGSCSWLYSCCMSCSWSSCCCRTTVIEVYLLCMKALLLCGLANLGAFVSLQVDYTSMARGQAVIECLAAFATMTTLTVLSRRIRSLLQGLGVAQSQPAIEQHLSRIVTVTVGVNAYLCAHVAMLLFYLHVTTSSSEWALLLCADKRSWSLFVGLRYGSEVAVMCVELFVSRILQKKGAGAKAGGGGGGGGVADSPRQRNSGARVIGVSGGRGASKGASRSSEFGVQTDDEFADGGGAMLVGAADIEMAASPPGLVSSGGAGTSSGAKAYSNKTITVGRGKGSGGGAASERTPLLSSVGVLGLGALAARAAVAPSPRKK